MALIQCPDCQTEVSDDAPSCLRCGRQFRERSMLGVIATGLFLVFSFVMAVWLIGELLYLGLPSRVMTPWATGSVILGMLALVTGTLRRPVRRATPPPKASLSVSRAIERRHARGEGLVGEPKREQQGGRGTEPPTDEAGRGCQNPDDQPGNDRPRHEMDGASI